MRRIQIRHFAVCPYDRFASAQPTLNAGGILNNASYATGIAQGSMFAVFGNGLGSSGTVSAFPGQFTVDNGSTGRDVSSFRTNITVPAPLRFDSTGTASIRQHIRGLWTFVGRAPAPGLLARPSVRRSGGGGGGS
jgi:hypothetical protein